MGPAVEVFGFEHVFLGGSAPSTVTQAQSNAGDWYKITVINLRLYVRHSSSQIWALMLCFIIYLGKRFAVVAVVGFHAIE